jgi:adenosylmethionine-8-amino-7-oxononanoate aminotransferase
LSEHPHVGDIRGRGLLIGIELVTDRDSKAPAAASLAGVIKNTAMENGLIIYPGGGTADGRSGAHILLAPPFIYNSDNVGELIDKLVMVLASVDFEP